MLILNVYLHTYVTLFIIAFCHRVLISFYCENIVPLATE